MAQNHTEEGPLINTCLLIISWILIMSSASAVCPGGGWSREPLHNKVVKDVWVIRPIVMCDPGFDEDMNTTQEV